jgi:hypothetical protein
MNLSFPGILIEEGFLASLGMTAKRDFQQPPDAERMRAMRFLTCGLPCRGTRMPP